jgi:hypothetical protein
MSKKKPDNTALADQLKGLATKLEQDRAAATQAQRNAQARLEQEARDQQAAREKGISDEERFERAMGNLGRRDVARKFDDVPEKQRPVGPAREEPRKSEEDQFLDAMNTMEKAFKKG